MKQERLNKTKNWKSIKLGDLCEINIGRTPSRARRDYWGPGNKWLSIADMNQGRDLLFTKETITNLAAKECNCYLAPVGTVLLSFKLSIGKVGIARTPLYTNEAIASLPIKRKDMLLTEYLFWTLQSIDLTLGLDRAAKGLTLNKAKLLNIKIPVPPISEQKRIADILDKAESLRAKRREAITLINSLTQSIFLEMFGNPIENRMDWKTATVGDATECIVPGRDKPKSFSGDIPWVTTNDLNHLASTFKSSKNIGLSNAEITEVRAKVIPRGSVIMSCVGDLGILSIAGNEMVINQQLHSFQCSEALNNIFLMYCLSFQKAFMYAKASSTTLPYMNKSVCNSIPIILPPKELQEKFADKAKAVANMMSVESIFFEQADILFSSIQKMAFSGNL